MKNFDIVVSFVKSLGLFGLFLLFNTILLAFKVDTIIIDLISYILFIGIVYFIYREKICKDIKNYTHDIINCNYKVLLISIGLLVTQIIITGLFTRYGIVSPNNAKTISMISNPVYAILVVTLVPIAEELMIRLPYHKNNTQLSFIIYTIIFAVLHVITDIDSNTLLYIIPYALLSIGISLSYYKTNNIIVSISAHIINNLLCLVILFI